MCTAIANALIENQTNNTHKHKYANTETQRQKQKNANGSFYKSKCTAGKETNVWPVALHRRGQQGRENSAHCKIPLPDTEEKTLRTADCKSYTVVCKISLPGCTQLSTPNIALHTVRYIFPLQYGQLSNDQKSEDSYLLFVFAARHHSSRFAFFFPLMRVCTAPSLPFSSFSCALQICYQRNTKSGSLF